MKIILLSSVQVLGYRSMVCIVFSKFYAINMTGHPFGQKWYRYQKGYKGLRPHS